MASVDSVLLCSDYLPPSDGGVEVVVETLAKQLNERGIRVGIFTLESPDIGLRSHDEIEVFESKTIDLTHVLGVQSQLSPSALWEFRRVAKQFAPTIIHAHNRFFFTSLVASFWSQVWRNETPLVLSLHLGSVENIGGWKGRAAIGYENTVGRFVLRGCDRLIAVSEAVAAHGKSLGGEDVRMIPNGVDPDEFVPRESQGTEVTVLFVGRLVKNKGPHVFIRSCAELTSLEKPIEVRIVGTGPMRPSLEEEVQKLGIEGNVTFCGYVESVADELRNADVFCRPSFSEGMPLTLLEAMSSGLPAVVTPVAGVPEVVSDNTTGYLVPTGEIEPLTDALAELIQDEEKRREMGKRSREVILEEYSWSVRTDRILSTYQETLSTT